MKGSFSIKSVMPRGLFARSLLILIVPVILIQAITTYIFLERHWQSMSSRLASSVAGEVALITERVESFPDPLQLAWIQESVASKLDIKVDYQPGVWIETRESVAAYKFWELVLLNNLRQQLEGRISSPFNIRVDFVHKRVYIMVQLEDGTLTFSVPERRLFSSTSYIFLLWMFGSALLLLIVAVLFMRGQTRPIRRLAIAAERFGKGRETANFKPSGAREVRQAARAFLTMQERIKRQIEQRTMMLAGVSHDLRTPLTRLKLQLGMMGEGKEITDMKGDILMMEKMIEGYLDFVRGNNDEELVENTSLNALLSDIIAKKAAINFDTTSEDIIIPVKPVALKRALGNIIDNALKYADNVWVSYDKQELDGNPFIAITIEDDGPGISKDMYDEVFRPFMRLDQSRNLNDGGVGLGLAIAQDIILSHGGHITLSESNKNGLKVLISLPF